MRARVADALVTQPSGTHVKKKAGPLPRLFAALLVRALGSLSREGLRRLGAFVGGLAFALGIRRRVTLENLAQALPELPEDERRRIARGAYANMALAVLESLTSTRIPEAELDRVVEVENWDLLQGALAGGKGVLIATAHFGSWEMLGEVMCRRGLPINVVAKPLKGALNERIVQSRLESGVKLILPRGAVATSVEALARKEVVCMLIDQVIAKDRGVFVPFFNRPSSTTPALSLAARRSGAPVLVGMGAREGDRLRVFIEGPVPYVDTGDPDADLKAHVAQVTAIIEKWIRRYPDQWLWLHRRWKVQP